MCELPRLVAIDIVARVEFTGPQIVNQLKDEGATLHAEVLEGRVTESLAQYALDNNIDLILIATHGRSGVTRWVRGSVADKVLRSANVPVLMVRAPGTKGGI